jgi:phosphatidylglycerophosphate synthase
VKLAKPDGSRDPRTEDPTNIWFVHLIGRALLPGALKLGISANAVSILGLLLGAGAAWAYLDWSESWRAGLGFGLTIAWLIADGLDGMIARASGSASALGRFLDGLCDHGVFLFLYLALAASMGTAGAWLLAAAAGLVHGLQSTLYEGERMRYHRRIRGEAKLRTGSPAPPNFAVRLYDALAGSFDRAAEPFARLLAGAGDPAALGRLYGDRAWPPLRFLSLLSNNMRVILIFVACLIGDIGFFWWVELVPLTLVAAAGIVWHRRVEARLVAEAKAGAWTRYASPGMVGRTAQGEEE